MSFVTTQPEALTSATGTLQGTGSSMSAQDAAAAAIHEMFVSTLRYQRRIVCGPPRLPTRSRTPDQHFSPLD